MLRFGVAGLHASRLYSCSQMEHFTSFCVASAFDTDLSFWLQWHKRKKMEVKIVFHLPFPPFLSLTWINNRTFDLQEFYVGPMWFHWVSQKKVLASFRFKVSSVLWAIPLCSSLTHTLTCGGSEQENSSRTKVSSLQRVLWLCLVAYTCGRIPMELPLSVQPMSNSVGCLSNNSNRLNRNVQQILYVSVLLDLRALKSFISNNRHVVSL